MQDAQNSFIGRWVAGLILPLATLAAAVIGVKAKAWFGIELDTGEIVAWIVSIAVGGALWLYNRGRHEVAAETGLDEETVDKIVQRVIEEKLPGTIPGAPGAGAPAAPNAPPPEGALGRPGRTSVGQ